MRVDQVDATFGQDGRAPEAAVELLLPEQLPGLRIEAADDAEARREGQTTFTAAAAVLFVRGVLAAPGALQADDDSSIRPFSARIPQAAVDDLRRESISTVLSQGRMTWGGGVIVAMWQASLRLRAQQDGHRIDELARRGGGAVSALDRSSAAVARRIRRFFGE